MYSNQLEELIEAALADGVLTDKEKQILSKKAKAEGIDLDEFEMVLNARVIKAQQGTSSAPSAPKSKKYGNVRKCPCCGAVVQAYMAKCPECGYEFSDVEANESIKNLSEQIKKLEAQRGHGLRDNNVFNHMTGSISNTDKQIIALIKSFPIPNTKTDILEFLAFATPEATRHIDYYGEDAMQGFAPKRIKEAWKQKCQEIILRAERSLKDDELTMAEIEKYKKMLKPKFKLSKNVMIPIICVAVLVALCIVPLSIGISMENQEEEAINEQYEMLIQKMDELPRPTWKNVNTCIYELQKIQWSTEGDSEYERTKRNDFIKRKNDYIQLLQNKGGKIEKEELIEREY